MRFNNSEFAAFGVEDILSFFNNIWQKLENKIASEEDEYILNINEHEYISHLQSKYMISIPEVLYNDKTISKRKKDILGGHIPPTFGLEKDQDYSTQFIVYHIPFTGDPKYFKLRPTQLPTLYFPRIWIAQDCICFEIPNFYDNPADIENQSNNKIENFKKLYGSLKKEVELFNTNLHNRISNLFEQRKQNILKENNLLAKLGTPIRQSEPSAHTFAIPVEKQMQITISEPSVIEAGSLKDPTLDKSMYYAILNIIESAGKEFEKHPATYQNMKEEELRDILLLVLQGNFQNQASVTGETFNKSGKTDILISYKNSIVFIAECKFWSGKSDFLKAIDQVLSYLTWRDSKTARILFIKNKNFSSVLSNIEVEIENHPNFSNFIGKTENSWFNYNFHLRGDDKINIKLAVMAFHMPPLD